MKEYIINKTLSQVEEGLIPCIKQPVYAMLETSSGEQFFGTNSMIKIETGICPRDEAGFVSGEGYHLCKNICKQEFHAETAALAAANLAKVNTVGSTVYLVGHTYCCGNCTDRMKIAGVKKVIFVDTKEELVY